MQTIQLKLKQASAVLGMPAKDLQNLVQFGVVKPKKKAERYWFDTSTLLQAKVAWYLKESLGVSTDYLTRIVRAFSRASGIEMRKGVDVMIRSRFSPESAVIEVRIPLRRLLGELNRQLPLAEVFKDLPRGRKRPGWKQEFLRSIQAAAADLDSVTEQDILHAIREYRSTRKTTPEITVVPETKTKTA